MILKTFKVYPGRQVPYKVCRKRYFKVFVFDNKYSLRQAIKDHDKKYNLEGATNDELAIVMPFYKVGVVGSIGHAYFCKDYLGCGLLSHECVHMARGFLEIVWEDHNFHEDDEPLAYSVGSCMKQLVNNTNDLCQ